MTHTTPRYGLLLINLGTPDSTATGDVRKYLREFLSDPRVIDLPAPLRWALLNLIILPFRPAKSAAAYREIWTEQGSPLLVHGKALCEKLQQATPDDVVVKLAMRYGSPSISAALDSFRQEGVDKIAALPLFPQYAAASTGSAAEKVLTEAARRWDVPEIQFVGSFYDHPGFVNAVAGASREAVDEAEHTLLSFHGVPVRHCTKSDPEGTWCSQRPDCCDTIVEQNRFCYRAQCFATARAVQAELGLTADNSTVCFQSRLGRTPWIKPYTDHVLVELAERGVKRLAVIEPSFVADCLETLEEIGIRAVEDFQAAGGEQLWLAPCVNASDAWVRGLLDILQEQVSWLSPRGGSTEALPA